MKYDFVEEDEDEAMECPKSSGQAKNTTYCCKWKVRLGKDSQKRENVNTIFSSCKITCWKLKK